jgi:hypothetical protein
MGVGGVSGGMRRFFFEYRRTENVGSLSERCPGVFPFRSVILSGQSSCPPLWADFEGWNDVELHHAFAVELP